MQLPGRNIPRPTLNEVRELAVYAPILPFIFLPRAAGMWVCRLIARFLMRDGCAYRKEMEERLPGPIPGFMGRTTKAALIEFETHMLYGRVRAVRGALRKSWNQRVELRGREHIDEALRAGKGVILWTHRNQGSAVYAKQAIFEAGIPLVHLTRAEHGLTGDPLSLRYINPWLNKSEYKFLQEAVYMEGEKTVGALRRINRLLRQNAVVSIAVANTASRLHEYPMFDGYVSLPAGPVELAASTGAALLPVFTSGTEKVPLVEVGPPLPAGGKDEESVRTCHEALAGPLAEWIRDHPGEWTGWRGGSFRRSDADAHGG